MNFSGKREIVKEVQTLLNIPATGLVNPLTYSEICKRLQCSPGNSSIDAITAIQTALRFSKKDIDGIDGSITWNAIRSELENAYIHTLSPASLQLIIDYEVGGGSGYYNKELKFPSYPGGASGVTIGIGYDIGYNSVKQFAHDWGDVLSKPKFDRLVKHCGKKGAAAKVAVLGVRDIEIPWSVAHAIFLKTTIPRFVKETLRTFPNADKLHPDAFGALVSLVFNRGGSLSGQSRLEMFNIKQALIGNIQTENIYEYISGQVLSMKRIWVGKNLPGLLRRRDAEAALILKSNSHNK
jgi:hypothetical protein